MTRLTLRLYRAILRAKPSCDRFAGHDEAAVALLASLLRDAQRTGGRRGVWRVSAAAIADAVWRVLAGRARAIGSALFAGTARDLQDAVRGLRRRSPSAVAAIATLALGVGVNAAVGSIFDWVLLRPLPYPRAEQLARISSVPLDAAQGRGEVTFTEFTALSQSPLFQASAAVSIATRVIAAAGTEPVHATIARVSGDLFAVLGVPPALGRTFDRVESASGASVAVLSHRLWRDRFAGAPSIVGRALTIDGTPFTVIGVMPPAIGQPPDADLWYPLTAAEREDDDREHTMIGRLAAGVTADRAAREINAQQPRSTPARRIGVEGLQQTGVRDVRAALILLTISSAFVLLIAVANVATLQTARSADRTGELAVRAALGASRSRLARLIVIETLLLASAGGVAGLVAGRWILAWLITLAPALLPRAGEIALDTRLLLAGAVVTLGAGLVSGFAASRRASRPDLHSCLASAAGLRVAGRASARALIAVQAALAIMLTSGALLLARSLHYLVSQDEGFAAERLVAVDLYLRAGATTAAGDERELYRQLVAAAETVPGVTSAAVTMLLPTRTIGPRVAVSIRGLPPAADPSRPGGQAQAAGQARAILRPVSAGYFATAGIPLIAGRSFSERDTRQTPLVAIVNAAFVREFAGGVLPVGAKLTAEIASAPLTVVAVAADITPAGERDRPAVYVLCEQVRAGAGFLMVRTGGRPAAAMTGLSERLRQVAPALARDRIHVVADDLARGRAVERFSTQMASAFAILALGLAAVGLYGLTADELGRRQREIAIRLAVGGTRTAASWGVMRPTGLALVAGAVLGLGGALIAARWMRGLLHGVGPADPAALAAAPALFAVVAAVAFVTAASRIRRANPVDLLRQP
jgi:putative ABC transport system permease protein